ncbi:MAG: sigma-54-dependent Fis family transcriptional regulator [Proteobacteria bacterium]|nr:sigma-54-dependent Fis family transcriptional regulator [Pseudomonadota bacterium]
MAQKGSVLLVDDDELLLSSFEHRLKSDFAVFLATNASTAQQILKSKPIDCVVLDLHLGDEKGEKLIHQWKKTYPFLEIIVLSGQKEITTAIECMRSGALDYLVKPMEPEELIITIERALESRKLKINLEKLEPLVRPQPVPFLGSSAALQEVMDKAALLKHKTHLNVLILGESGTGKEVLARYLYEQENDHGRPFVVANMPAIPVNLLEAELFGVEKGAFTDAKFNRPGKFELADSGDIFLDEIGDLPLEMQSKILRVLQEKQVQRLGSNKIQNLSFRTISATNQPLSEMILNGKFREDLLYRLSDVVLFLPPLRERKCDIPLLVEHFIKKHSVVDTSPTFSSTAIEQLMRYEWPGNIRQLESTVKRALAFSKSGRIDSVEIYDLKKLDPRVNSQSVGLANTSRNLLTQMRDFERKTIENTLQKNGGKKTPSMKELGLTRATFYRKLNDLGISQVSP